MQGTFILPVQFLHHEIDELIIIPQCLSDGIRHIARRSGHDKPHTLRHQRIQLSFTDIDCCRYSIHCLMYVMSFLEPLQLTDRH